MSASTPTVAETSPPRAFNFALPFLGGAAGWSHRVPSPGARRAALLILLLSSPALAGSNGGPDHTPRPGAPSPCQVLTLRLTGGNVPASAGKPFDIKILGLTRSQAPLPLHRDPTLVPGRLVVCCTSADGETLFRTLIPDPRLLRVEATETPERLERHETLRDTVTLTVAFPVDPRIRWMEIRCPEWTGSAFRLVLLGAVEVPHD